MLSLFKDLFRGIRTGAARDQIECVDQLVSFVASHAAHVAQSSLYGYLAKRMGTRSREIFQDPDFSEPLIGARRTMLLSCLSDLAIFAAALIAVPRALNGADAARLARTIFDAALCEADGALPERDIDRAANALGERTVAADWAALAEADVAFSASPASLAACAPVTEALMEDDIDIVINSVRFRWVEPRRQLRERIDAEAVARDFAGH